MTPLRAFHLLAWCRNRLRATVTLLLVAALGQAACTGFAASARVPAGPVRIELSYFYEELSPWGDWIWLSPWGRVWRPWGVGFGWVPYSYGRWIYTDFGWSWVSHWDWGWAPFHYGRWRCDSIYGWVWVPGTVWAPAWVVWRHGPGWFGWAPLPPGARWDAASGLRYDSAEVEIHAWSFVRADDFSAARMQSRIEPRARNATLIGATRELVRFEARGTGVAERGLERELVERATGRTVERRRVEDSARPPHGARDSLRGDAVRLYRPEVRPTPAPEPPAAVAPVPPSAEERASQRRLLESWAEAEQRRLDKIHQQQQKQPPAELPRAQLEQRQQEERKAMNAEVARRERWLESQREKPAAKAQPKPKPKPPPKQKPPGGEGS